MQTYDIFMLVVLAGATLFGFWKGLAWQLASIGSIVVSYFAATYFREPVAAAIDAEPPWNMFLAMLIIYVAASLAIWIAFAYVRRLISQLQLKGFDRQMGGLLGIAKGVLLCTIITLFAVTLLGEERRRSIVNSTSGYYIAVLLDRSHAIMPPEVHEVLHPYVERLDANIGQGGPKPPSPMTRPASTFGGPLFGGDASRSWPVNPTSNSGRQQGSGLWPSSQPAKPQTLKEWTDEQLRAGQQAIRNQIQSGQQQFQQKLRSQVQEKLDRYLPPSSMPR